MNKHTLLRILCGLTFLIFLCPFYQGCSDEKLRNGKQIAIWNSRVQRLDSTYTPKTEKKEASFIKKANDSIFLEKKRRVTYSGYELIDDMFTTTGDFNYLSLAFIIIIVCSAFQFFYSFKSRYATIRVLGFINLFMALLYIILQLFFLLLEDITQIKYGYYLFIINTIAITLLSKKLTDHEI